MKTTAFALTAFFLPLLLTGQGFSVLSWNIRFDAPNDGPDRWEHRKEDLAALLHYYRPALFGIQEGEYHQVGFLDSSLVDYDWIGVGRDDGRAAGEFSAIFYDRTRFGVVSQGTFWLSETSEVVSVGWDAAMERICTYGLFTHLASGRKIFCLNTHFDHKGEVARKMSARLIIEKLKALNPDGYPVILTGDLNCEPDSPPHEILTVSLDDSWEISEKPPFGPAGTFNGFALDARLDRRIDYILVSGGLAVASCAHLDHRTRAQRFLSDHLPVLVEVRLLAE